MKQCNGTVFRDYRNVSCPSNGTLEHDGKWYCKKHHPPTVDARTKERHEKWELEWAEQKRQRKAAQREQALKDLALDYMREHHAEIVMEWETQR